jgi:S-methylmethionine-dependent homocysteine/selenocysteine methylase
VSKKRKELISLSMDVSVRTAMATSFIDVLMNAQEAQDFHSHQISIWSKDTKCRPDWCHGRMIEREEAFGIARAAQKNDIPVVISFTVEADGKLCRADSRYGKQSSKSTKLRILPAIIYYIHDRRYSSDPL